MVRHLVRLAGTLDVPALFQTACTWLALLAMSFWVGGLIWEVWILPPSGAANGDLDAAVVARHCKDAA